MNAAPTDTLTCLRDAVAAVDAAVGVGAGDLARLGVVRALDAHRAAGGQVTGAARRTVRKAEAAVTGLVDDLTAAVPASLRTYLTRTLRQTGTFDSADISSDLRARVLSIISELDPSSVDDVRTVVFQRLRRGNNSHMTSTYQAAVSWVDTSVTAMAAAIDLAHVDRTGAHMTLTELRVAVLDKRRDTLVRQLRARTGITDDAQLAVLADRRMSRRGDYRAVEGLAQLRAGVHAPVSLDAAEGDRSPLSDMMPGPDSSCGNALDDLASLLGSEGETLTALFADCEEPDPPTLQLTAATACAPHAHWARLSSSVLDQVASTDEVAATGASAHARALAGTW